MNFQVLIFSVLLAVCQAGLLQEAHPQQTLGHFTPLVSTPVLRTAAPVYEQQAYEHGPLVTQLGSVHGAVQAGPLVQHVAQHAPVVQHLAAVGRAEHVEDLAPPKYEFSYSIDDPTTGDHKSQHESRDGDVVKGEYSLVQPDGSVRKVEYTADDHSGFNAVVHNSEPNAHAVPNPVQVHVAPRLDHAAQLVHAPVVQASPQFHAPAVHAPLVQTPLVHGAPQYYSTHH